MAARYDIAGVNSTWVGYFLGGGSTASSEIDGILFTSQAAYNPTAALAAGKFGGAGVSSSSKGYICGGWTTTYVSSIEALTFATERRQFGQPIADFQAVGFMLSDMAAEIMAAKSMLYRVCWEAAHGGIDRKRLHAEASAVKLVCSETAGRVADRAVQILGGRGYMREQAVERHWRELRVDRIWEGTSEIQRLVILHELRKRGPEAFTSWPAP